MRVVAGGSRRSARSPWRMRARGGQQRIPRPPSFRPGGPPPWAGARRPTGAGSRSPTSAPGSPRCRPRPTPVARAPRAAVAAAVLVPLFEDDGEAYVVLIKRPETMPSHQGEIAFPGGKFEPGVDADLRATALREAHEEIGLDPGRRRGRRPARRHRAPSRRGSRSRRSSASCAAGPCSTPNPSEVVRVLEVPLSELLGRRRLPRGALGRVADATSTCTSTSSTDETVWGATARILTELPRAPRRGSLSVDAVDVPRRAGCRAGTRSHA